MSVSDIWLDTPYACGLRRREPLQERGRLPGHLLAARPMIERAGLHVLLDLGAEGVAQTLGVLLGPAETFTEEELPAAHRHLIRAQPVGGESAEVALVSQNPPGLTETDHAEQAQYRSRTIGHSGQARHRPLPRSPTHENCHWCAAACESSAGWVPETKTIST